MKKQLRQLRVDLTSTKGNSRDSVYGSYPRIRLQGNWLNELGFTPGSKVQVLCNTNEIIISSGRITIPPKLRQAKGNSRDKVDKSGASGKRIALMQGDHIVGNSLGSYASRAIGD